MNNEPSDDYFGVVAEVVEAARQLEEAQRLDKEADDLRIKRYDEKRAAEKALFGALEKLKKVDVGRSS